MYDNYGKHLVEKIRNRGFEKQSIKIKGCNQEEIEILKLCQCVQQLPKVYEQVMLNLGHSTGGRFLLGWDCDYETIITAKQYAIREFYEYGFKLPHEAFVFALLDQGTGCFYFVSETMRDNPTVYIYTEGAKNATVYKNRLTDFYESQLP